MALWAVGLSIAGAIWAEQDSPEPEKEPAPDSQMVVYEAEFFARYGPVTALDMVRQVPGFRLERRSLFGGASNVRGFGAAAGNVLINGKRPSTKSDDMDSLLSRIAAEEVLRLELIRGAAGAGDRDITQGSVVLNVVLDESTGGRDAAPWQGAMHYEDDALSFNGEAAFSTRVGNTSYLMGLKRTEWDWNLKGLEHFTSAARPAELRDEIFFRSGDELNLDFKTATEFSSGAALRFNVTGQLRKDDESEVSARSIEGGADELFLRDGTTDSEEFELAGDYERDLTSKLSMKLIALAGRTRVDGERGLEIEVGDVRDESRRSRRSSDSGESIGRLEFDWSGWSRHRLKFGGEYVHNFVDSASELLVDNGSGPVVVEVPGSDTRVVERRSEAFVTDSWQAAEKVTIDLGFGYEVSEITQSGDIDNSRSFTYPKPSIAVAYSPSPGNQWRFRVERRISQLNFFDFVSASNFEDEDLDLGNPDLRPETTWHFSTIHERRFGDVGVVEVEVFYDKIDDVEDLLPVGEGFEIVGNIGQGTREGARITMTVPLTFLGLGDSRADVTYTVQSSSVTDPVTGLERELSGESDQDLDLSLRKEIPKARAALGADFNWSSTPTSYGSDELVSETQRSHTNIYFEKRVGKNTKMRFEVFNLLDPPRFRRRTVFEGSRLSKMVAFEENRRRTDGQWFRLTLSGLF